MIVSEYERWAVSKRYTVVGNNPDSVFETLSAIYRNNKQIQRVLLWSCKAKI